MENSVYRIIDANFNRAREAARVMEEYCRFHLNSAGLSSRAKHLRHQLCTAVDTLDNKLLIGARDSQTDVGRAMKVSGQMSRKTLQDCFTAASKRITEALRALAEATQTFDAELAQTFEKLRFEAYSLEKDIILFADTREKFKQVRLYVLLTVTEKTTDSEFIELARQCAQNGADCIQLRAKNIPDNRILSLACELTKICKQAGILSIINDRIDIAALSAADGVHLGQDDLEVSHARKLSQPPMIVGLSTHNIDQLKAAIAQNPDYVGLGPFYSTDTKPGAEAVGPEYISRACKILDETGIGHVAIGGITLENIGFVLEAGARTVAVCSEITNAADPGMMCRKLKEAILSRL